MDIQPEKKPRKPSYPVLAASVLGAAAVASIVAYACKPAQKTNPPYVEPQPLSGYISLPHRTSGMYAPIERPHTQQLSGLHAPIHRFERDTEEREKTAPVQQLPTDESRQDTTDSER